MTDFPVARTRDEALLYLDLHPCACGSAETDWDNSLATVDGVMVSRYAGVCGGCGAQREYLFALPERETPVAGFPTFGGEEPSRLLDAGEWLWVADRVASNVPRGEERQALSVARAAVDEVIKFIEPGRFDLERLLVVRDAYRTLASY